MARTAWQRGHRRLYHWQRFDPNDATKLDRFNQFLRTGRLHCSSPSAFNDPWDCRPHLNTDLLDDAHELQRHVEWAVDITSRRTPMPPDRVEAMRQRLAGDVPYAKELLTQMSASIVEASAAKQRVYCLGPDPTNTLMWSHYAEDHKGICLEYSLENDVMSCALECEYLAEFPQVRPYRESPDELLRVLLAKSNVWGYENEFRLVVEERALATPGADVLLCDDSKLQLPQGALLSVIVGCQGPVEAVRQVVREAAPQVSVRRAVRVPNRYELRIE